MKDKVQQHIRKRLEQSIEVKQQILKEGVLVEVIYKIAETIVHCYKNGGSVWLCGNGGSAADAQHIAAELSGRYYLDRPPLRAEALHVNTSYLTAVANDYGYEEVYARLINAVGKKGDILIGISTSGNSKNVVKAFVEAQKKEMIIIAFTGKNNSEMEKLSHLCLKAPSTDTPRIQEAHITIGHIICEIVENELFGK